MKDSGTRTEFASGAVRDGDRDSKSRPDLSSPFVELRLGEWRRDGALKYSDRNWEKGMPLSGYLASAMRHLAKFRLGETDEDHLAAAIWNLESLMHTQMCVEEGLLPAELDDLPNYLQHRDDLVEHLCKISGETT